MGKRSSSPSDANSNGHDSISGPFSDLTLPKEGSNIFPVWWEWSGVGVVIYSPYWAIRAQRRRKALYNRSPRPSRRPSSHVASRHVAWRDASTHIPSWTNKHIKNNRITSNLANKMNETLLVIGRPGRISPHLERIRGSPADSGGS